MTIVVYYHLLSYMLIEDDDHDIVDDGHDIVDDVRDIVDDSHDHIIMIIINYHHLYITNIMAIIASSIM